MQNTGNWRERFKQAMLNRKLVLEQALRSDSKPADADSGPQMDVGDFADMASSDTTKSMAAGLAEIESSQLAQVEEALQRMEDGTYGRCVDCGKPISQARLQALPFAIRCIDCQAAFEGGGRVRRP